MLADARVVHRSPGRLRIRFEQHRRDAASLSRLCSALGVCPGIVGVSHNPLTGSLLILHHADEATILRFAASQGLFETAPHDSGPPDVQAEMAAGLDGFSQALRRVSGNSLDANGLLVLGLAALAIQQAIEGNVMVPAASLLWYAYSASRMPPLGRVDPATDPGDLHPASTEVAATPKRGGGRRGIEKSGSRRPSSETHRVGTGDSGH
ncbi:MAG: hypothetical protein MUC79_09915 [Thiobacillaceae bacterium]|nr:hypothetical protein [Thiobacillaceae bacterium]